MIIKVTREMINVTKHDTIGKITFNKYYAMPELPIHYFIFRYNNGFVVLGGGHCRRTLRDDIKRVRSKKAIKDLMNKFDHNINQVNDNSRFLMCGRISSMFLSSYSKDGFYNENGFDIEL